MFHRIQYDSPRYLPAAIFGVVLATFASSNAWATPIVNGPLSLEILELDNFSGGTSLEPYVTSDILTGVNGGILGGQQLRISLTSGSIYQHELGSTSPPSQGVVDVFPSLKFDSFVANGSEFANGPFGDPSLGGGAVDLLGPPAAFFDTSEANLSWTPLAGTMISDPSSFLSARVTLSDDAQGTWTYFLGSFVEDQYTIGNVSAALRSTHESDVFPFSIHDGRIKDGRLIVVPEPPSGLIAMAVVMGIVALRDGTCMRRARWKQTAKA